MLKRHFINVSRNCREKFNETVEKLKFMWSMRNGNGPWGVKQTKKRKRACIDDYENTLEQDTVAAVKCFERTILPKLFPSDHFLTHGLSKFIAISELIKECIRIDLPVAHLLRGGDFNCIVKNVRHYLNEAVNGSLLPFFTKNKTGSMNKEISEFHRKGYCVIDNVLESHQIKMIYDVVTQSQNLYMKVFGKRSKMHKLIKRRCYGLYDMAIPALYDSEKFAFLHEVNSLWRRTVSDILASSDSDNVASEDNDGWSSASSVSDLSDEENKILRQDYDNSERGFDDWHYDGVRLQKIRCLFAEAESLDEVMHRDRQQNGPHEPATHIKLLFCLNQPSVIEIHPLSHLSWNCKTPPHLHYPLETPLLKEGSVLLFDERVLHRHLSTDQSWAVLYFTYSKERRHIHI
eukprot:GHVL01007105.1.p1 GENE.GHVL01007105.1~~GHVL01007105.1.p1  ORF type:complete len:404 (+),score=44.15 GHVL01007105.1:640-1851(+)